MSGVVEQYLSGLVLTGADRIRARLLLQLASELDNPSAPSHAVPRVVSQLRALLNEIAQTSTTTNENGSGSLNVRALLADLR